MAGILCIVGFLVLWLTHLPSTTDEPSDTAASQAGNCINCQPFFSLKKISLTHVDGSGVLLRLSADTVLGRPRRGRLVTFYNYDEIYLEHLTIEQPLNSKIVKLDSSGIAKLFQAFEDGDSDSQNHSTEETAIDIVTDPAKHSMSRMLVDEIKISLEPDRQQPIILTASHAKMGTDAAVIKFEQNVKLTAAKCSLLASVAIWSNEYSGLFLPDTYRLNGHKHSLGGFFQVSQTGRCIRVKPTPVIAYVDSLDKLEDKFFEALPMPMRLLFGVVGAPVAPIP